MPKPTLLPTETPGGALELREQAQLSLGFCFYSDPPAMAVQVLPSELYSSTSG